MFLGRLFGSEGYIKSEIEKIDSYNVPEHVKIQMKIDLFNYYTPFKLAQRYLAMLITMIYVGTLVITGIYHYAGLDYKGMVAIVEAFSLGLVMLAIVGFYFGGGAISSLKKDPVSYDVKYDNSDSIKR